MVRKSFVSSQPAGLKSMSSEDIKNRLWTEREQQALRIASVAQASGDDSDIDFSDIPRLTEEQLSSLVRLRGGKRKVAVSVRLDPQVLDWPVSYTHLDVYKRQVMELSAPFEMTQPAISRHLKVLETAGLIIRRIDGSKRPARLAPNAIESIDQWLDMLRHALTKNYDRLDQILTEIKPEKGENPQ